MTIARVRSRAAIAAIGAALMLLISACGEEASDEPQQGAAPTTQPSDSAGATPSQPAEGQPNQ
jgi:hypothetical protein